MGFFSSTSTQDSKQQFDNNQSASSTNRPLYDDEVLFQRNFILDYLRQMVSNGPQGVQEYTSGGLSNIDKGGEIKRRMAENMLRSRGLANTSSGASYISGVDNSNTNDKINFLNTIPLFALDQQRQNIGALGNFTSGLPVGSSGSSVANSSGTSNTNTRTTTPGGIFQDLLGAAMGGAGLFFGSRKPSGGSGGNI